MLPKNLAATCCAVIIGVQCPADELPLFVDFTDAESMISVAQWKQVESLFDFERTVTSPATLSVENDELTVSAASTWVVSELANPEEFSVRSVIRFAENDYFGLYVGAGLGPCQIIGCDMEVMHFTAARMNSNGELFIESHRGSDPAHGYAPSGLDPTKQDIELEVSVDGLEASLKVWPVGGEIPSTPQLSAFVGSRGAGKFGFFAGPSLKMQTFVATPEPGAFGPFAIWMALLGLCYRKSVLVPKLGGAGCDALQLLPPKTRTVE